MKKSILLILLSISSLVSAQIGINTTTPNAQLDINSTNQAAPSNTDGILIPRVDAFPVTNPTAAQEGMLIFLTTAIGTKTPGFYYWDNAVTSWVGVGSKGNWGMAGNAGTNATNNFMGTTDNNDIAFKTNNTETLRLTAGGKVGVGTANPFSKFHVFENASGMTPNPGSVFTIENNNDTYLSLLSGNKESGLLFGDNGNSTNGAIIYNSPNSPEGFFFRTNGNVDKMVLTASGTLGIGDFIPTSGSPLEFPPILGNKVCLYNSGATNKYGFGIGSGLLQMFSDAATTNIGFGYGDSTAFTENVRFTGTGKVGIGISNPVSKLHVFKNGSGMTPNANALATLESTSNMYFNLLVGAGAETGILFGTGGNATNGGILYNSGTLNQMGFRTNNNITQMTISAAGNVGVGKANVSANAKMEVVSTSQSAPSNTDGIIIPKVDVFPVTNPTSLQQAMLVYLTTTSGSNLPGFYYWDNSTSSWIGVGNKSNWGINGNTGTNSFTNFIGTADNQSLAIRTNNIERVVLDTAGNIGLGSFAPSYPLEFKKTVGDKICFYNSGTSNIYGIGVQNTLLQLYCSTAASDIAFGYGTSSGFTENIRFKGTGEVGIGTSFPSSFLHIQKSASGLTPNVNAAATIESAGNTYLNLLSTSAETGILFGANGNATNGAIIYNPTSAPNNMLFRTNNNSEVMRLTASGNVGIGTTAPTSELEVNGYTKLGSSAPAVKMLKLTGTTAGAQGGQVSVNHGLTSSKILSVAVLVDFSPGNSIPPSYGGSAGYEYDYYVTTTNISIWNKAGNSGNILSKSFRILVTYE